MGSDVTFNTSDFLESKPEFVPPYPSSLDSFNYNKENTGGHVTLYFVYSVHEALNQCLGIKIFI